MNLDINACEEILKSNILIKEAEQAIDGIL